MKDGRFSVMKIGSTRNSADILTKPKAAKEMGEKLKIVGARIIKNIAAGRIQRPRWCDILVDEDSHDLGPWGGTALDESE